MAMAGFSVSYEELSRAAYNEFDQRNCDETLFAAVSADVGATNPNIRDQYVQRRVNQFKGQCL